MFCFLAFKAGQKFSVDTRPGSILQQKIKRLTGMGRQSIDLGIANITTFQGKNALLWDRLIRGGMI